MLEIKNTEIWGLERAARASGNPMTVGEINTKDVVAGGGQTLNEYVSDKDYNRVKKLGSTPIGSAHDHFLLGIHVQFDIKYPQYWTIEAERYHNFEIISSQSKMHRLTIMGKDDEFHSMFNEYVLSSVKEISRKNIEYYNKFVSQSPDDFDLIYLPEELQKAMQRNFNETIAIHKSKNKELYDLIKYNLFMRCISNLPMGFEMWMTCDLTYLQLKTIYFQRENHKLKEDWGAFCDWCESLPMFKQLIGI